MITVELDIFSAKPNPVWTLTDTEAKELIDRVLANPSLTDPPKSSGGLGYRGFIITASDEAKTTLEKAGLPSFFYVESRKRAASELALVTAIETGRAVPQAGKRFALGSIKADRKLREDFWKKHRSKDSLNADTPKGKGYEPSLDPSLKPNIPLDAPRPDPLLPAPPPPPPSSSAGGSFIHASEANLVSEANFPLACGPNIYTSDTDFSYWNDSYSVIRNNCYNYASDYRSDTFAQPGRKSNVAHTALACNNAVGTTSYCAAYDGFTAACWTGNEFYTCLVIDPDPDGDYHWYRRCANGHWCHKPGTTPARNYDESGYWITNPETCNRGRYGVVCGYRYFPYGWTVS
jgi:hypothetical protein